jgi:hypothetical protein
MTPAKMAAELLRGRQQRNAIFALHQEGFGEPAWDMLLSLFVADSDGRSSVSAGELVAATTTDGEIARPYTLWLASQGLVEIAYDRVRLTTAGRGLMTTYLEYELVR